MKIAIPTRGNVVDDHLVIAKLTPFLISTKTKRLLVRKSCLRHKVADAKVILHQF